MFVKKIVKSLFTFILLFLTSASLASNVFAGYDPNGCNDVTNVSFEDTYQQTTGAIELTFDNLTVDKNYYLAFDTWGFTTSPTVGQVYKGQPLTFKLPIIGINTYWDSISASVVLMRDETPDAAVCTAGDVIITKNVALNCKFRVTQNRNVGTDATPDVKACDVMADTTGCVERGSSLFVEVDVRDQNDQPVNAQIDAEIRQGICVGECWQKATTKNGQNTFEFQTGAFPGGEGKFEIRVSQDTFGGNYLTCPPVSYDLTEGKCKNAAGAPICGADGGVRSPPTNNAGDANPYRLCDQIPNPSLQAQCETCAGGPFGRDGVWTAIGCINRDPKSIIKSLMQIGIGMGGGVALLSTLAGGFILSTSQGDPTKANQAKEIITNSIIGLLFIIFSVVILQFIGVRILNIPGFGSV